MFLLESVPFAALEMKTFERYFNISGDPNLSAAQMGVTVFLRGPIHFKVRVCFCMCVCVFFAGGTFGPVHPRFSRARPLWAQLRGSQLRHRWWRRSTCGTRRCRVTHRPWASRTPAESDLGLIPGSGFGGCPQWTCALFRGIPFKENDPSQDSGTETHPFCPLRTI